MTEVAVVDAVQSAVNTMRAAVDGLLTLDLSMTTGLRTTQAIADLEVQRRRLEAVDQALIAHAAEQGAVTARGATSLPDMIGGLTNASRAESRARVQRAIDLGPRRTLSGEPLEPIHPHTAAAVAAGEISTAHVTIITRCLGLIPAGAAPGVFDIGERYLVSCARHESPELLRRSAQLLLERVDPDGAQPREDEARRRRNFGLRDGHDGMAAPFGALTGECAMIWRTILDTLAAPRPADDGERDPRTAGQRYHDALLEAGLRLIQTSTLPATGGLPVTIMVRVDSDDLAREQRGEPGGVAQTAHDDLIAVADILRLAGEADVHEVVLAPSGGILDYGRTRRLACPAQRKVLTARDGGCSFPNCTRPASWCQVHHIVPWIAGGRTAIDNMCLVCEYHHREFERAGWAASLIDGVTHWTPPAWLDPEQKPRRNTAHHLPNIDFGPPPDTGPPPDIGPALDIFGCP